jgi:alpha-galactosidase
MQDALEKQDHVILYSLCEWGQAGVWEWGNSTANSWRMTDDINVAFTRVLHIMNYNSFHLNYVNFFGHNDADMLEVGNGDLTPAETRTHFAVWAAMKTPLLIGTDLSTLSDDNLEILKNKYLLAFSQDPVFGAPAMPYKWGTNPDWTYNDTYPAEFWSGSMTSGTLVLLVNPGPNAVQKAAVFSEIPQLKGDKFEITEVWSGKSLGCISQKYETNVTSHDTAAIVVGNAC